MKKQWFAYDPNDCPEFFETEEEAAKRAKEILAQYADYALTDGWDELTDMICYGKVTHAAMRTNEMIRGEVDEDGIDGEGIYWESDIEFKCDYEIQKLTTTEAKGVLSEQ